MSCATNYRNDWLKFLKRLKQEMRPKLEYDMKSRDVKLYGMRPHDEARKMEKIRKLTPEDEHAIDLIHIWGADLQGNALTVRLARRPNGRAEVWIYLRLPSDTPNTPPRVFTTPSQPDTQVYNISDKRFYAKGLYFEVLEPLRKWRIRFTGRLRTGVRNEWSPDQGELADVEFDFLWHPMYNYSEYPYDFNPDLMADSLSTTRWPRTRAENWKLSSTDWHEQWGQLRGNVEINKIKHRKPLYLFGTKFREHGTLNHNNARRRLVIRGMDSETRGVCLYGVSDDVGALRIYQGYIAPPSMMGLYSVSKCTVSTAEGGLARFFDVINDCNTLVNVKLVADDRIYELRIRAQGPRFTFFCGEKWKVRGSCQFVKMSINDPKGNGFACIETYEEHTIGSPVHRLPSVPLLKRPEAATDSFVLSMIDDCCMNRKIVGNKGASLALMASIKEEHKSFLVPRGFCLTKRCFAQHLIDHPQLERTIDELSTMVCGRKIPFDEVLSHCERARNFVNRVIYTPVRKEIEHFLMDTFGENADVRYAVRPSEIGEYVEFASADKQPAACRGFSLGLNDNLAILEAVLRCWGSQFTYDSVERRRQNGQFITPEIGVVIQEMVNAETSGSLISREKIAEGVVRMTIFANYGLGEIVMSGREGTDEFILNRSWDDELDIIRRLVGDKPIRMEMDDLTGVKEVPNSEEERENLCISDEIVLKLGQVAIEIEKAFGSPQNLEWAVIGNDVYILRARPTAFYSDLNKSEVRHESDSSFRLPNEVLTIGNIVEELPGALTPLMLTTAYRIYALAFQHMFMGAISFRFDPSVLYGTAIFGNHAFFDVIRQRATRINDTRRHGMSKAIEAVSYGRILDDGDLLSAARERYEEISPWQLKWSMFNWLWKGIFSSKKLAAQMQRRSSDYPDFMEGVTSPSDAYNRISTRILDIHEEFQSYLTVTIGSVFWNGALLYRITGNRGPVAPTKFLAKLKIGKKKHRATADFVCEHYVDFARNLGTTLGTESGEVPIKLHGIAQIISSDFNVENFRIMAASEAYNLLNGNRASTALARFDEFIAVHGHRGPREFDFDSMSWGSNKLAVVKILQVLAQPLEPSEEPSAPASKVMQSIYTTTRLDWFGRFILSRSKNAIRTREQAKSALIRLLVKFREAFRLLSRLLKEHGFIPDAKLVFFLTFDEIEQLMETRSVRLIRRSIIRMEEYERTNRWLFPEFVDGKPFPRYPIEVYQPTMCRQANGTTVCPGLVSGRARVIRFEEAYTLEPKEILIIHAIDTAWSAYFPMLAGIVTEVGGLISHGAVVARELGLPCIVNVPDALKIFKTGDYVELDASNGKISKERQRPVEANIDLDNVVP